MRGAVQEKRDQGVSPVIGMILIVAITVVLAAVVGMTVLGFGDLGSGGKVVGVVPQNTGNAEKPMQLTLWGADLAKMKGVQVAVATAEGERVGTPVNRQAVFSDGAPVLIEFEEGFSEGEYPVTVTGTFADGTEQMIYTGKVNFGDVKGRMPVETDDKEKLIVKAESANYWRVTLTDITKYSDKKSISKWRLDFGDGKYTEYTQETYTNKTEHTYASPSDPSEITATYTVTYRAYYNDGTVTTASIEIVIFGSYNENSLHKYVSNFKIEEKGEMPDHIDLKYVTSETYWKVWMDDKGIQINVNTLKNGANNVKFYIDNTLQTNSNNDGTGIYTGLLKDAKSGEQHILRLEVYNSSKSEMLTSHTVTLTIR